MNCVTNISEQVVKCYVKGISWFNFIEGKNQPTVTESQENECSYTNGFTHQ